MQLPARAYSRKSSCTWQMQKNNAMSSLPMGPVVEGGAAQRPQRVTLRGSYVIVRPLNPADDAPNLYDGTHGPGEDDFWLYMSEGPFPTLKAFRDYLDKR